MSARMVAAMVITLSMIKRSMIKRLSYWLMASMVYQFPLLSWVRTFEAMFMTM